MSEEQNAEALDRHATSPAVSPLVKQIIEALLFASDEPVTLQMLRIVFDDVNRDVPEGEKTTANNEEIRAIVEALNAEYEESNRAYRIQQLAGGYVFATDKKFATWVGRLFKEKARRKLSQTAVETLAIIAYKQPITKSEVEFIRGVNADYIMKTLLEKNLATIVGRAHGPGRPLLYGTTPDFLKHFGLNEISDLPKPREIEELLGETELEVEKRMLADQQEIEFKGKSEEKPDPNSRAPHIPRKKSKLQEPPKEDAGKTIVERLVPPQPKEKGLDEVESESMTEAPEEIVFDQPTTVPIDMKPESIGETAPSLAEESPQAEIHSVEPVSEAPQTMEVSTDVPGVDSPTEDDLIPSSVPAITQDSQEPGPAVTPEKVRASEAGQSLSESYRTEERDSKKGWSKWKIKVKTFFRKLFG
jgi:segregation and condensation protein B